MKYNIGEVMYTRKPVYGIAANVQVVIYDRKKAGRKTKVKVKDDQGNKTGWIYGNCLRKRRR